MEELNVAMACTTLVFIALAAIMPTLVSLPLPVVFTTTNGCAAALDEVVEDESYGLVVYHPP